MFGKAKDSVNMLMQARQLQSKMKALKVTGVSDDELVEITMDGLNEIQDVHIDDTLMELSEKKQLIKSMKQAIKDASKKLQKEMQSNVDMDQLRGMLGG